jgi:hypothetical protein
METRKDTTRSSRKTLLQHNLFAETNRGHCCCGGVSSFIFIPGIRCGVEVKPAMTTVPPVHAL